MTTGAEFVPTHQLQVADSLARLNQKGRSAEFEIKELPEKFIRWQLASFRQLSSSLCRRNYQA